MQRVSQLQLGIMFFLFHFSTATGFIMEPLASLASYQGWLTLIVAFAGGLLIAYFNIALARQKDNEFIVHYGTELIGRPAHIFMMIGYCLFFLHLASMMLREVTDFIIQIFLPTTPMWVVAGLFAFVISIAVRSGIEAIFRVASGFFFVISSTALIIPFLVGKDLKYDRAVALITHLNIGSLWQEAVPFVPWFGEMFLVLFIFPWLSQREKTFKCLLWACVASLFYIELYYILCLLLFGPHLASNLTYPTLEMIRFIRIGDFLENLDPLVVAIWLSSLFIKISILLYIPVLITSQLLGLKDPRPLSISFGAIMLGLTIHMVKNIIELRYFMLHAWPVYALLVECSPMIYWIAYVIKKRLQKAQLDQSLG